MKSALSQHRLSVCTVVVLASCAVSAVAQAATPTAIKGYTVSVFAQGNDKASAPDSIAYAHGHIFIGYGGTGLPDGSDGKSSYIVEYTVAGVPDHVYTVLGHNDGIKVNPDNGKVYAMQNEDAHPNLVIIDPVSKQQTVYQFASAPPHGGGYDDMVFRAHKLYLSCSNPANNPNARPAIVEAKVGAMIEVSETLAGDATAINVPSGGKVTLNLQDPDSMTLDTQGDLYLDSQGDSEVVVVRHPGTYDQMVLQIPLSSPYGAPQIDDTIFMPAKQGFFLVADTPANVVYAVHKDAFGPGVAYAAAVGAPDAQGVSEGFVGKLDLDSGYITPVITGMQSPHGMYFIPTDSDGDNDGD